MHDILIQELIFFCFMFHLLHWSITLNVVTLFLGNIVYPLPLANRSLLLAPPSPVHPFVFSFFRSPRPFSRSVIAAHFPLFDRYTYKNLTRKLPILKLWSFPRASFLIYVFGKAFPERRHNLAWIQNNEIAPSWQTRNGFRRTKRWPRKACLRFDTPHLPQPYRSISLKSFRMFV